jgi:hypothetical protein
MIMRLSVILAAAIALHAGKSVVLNWHAPTNSPDAVVGYNVYRIDVPPSIWAKINRDLVRSTTYEDDTVEPGHSYSYYIRSVDAKGNESAPSNQCSVTIPEKPMQKAIGPKQTK